METKSHCLVRLIINVWAKAGIQEYIISKFSVLNKLQALHKKYVLLKKKSVTLKDAKDKAKKEAIENEFVCYMEGLFDIEKENFEALLRANKEIPRTQQP